ncbi:hypothetical protein L1987_78100 [Smallanthus sonchifolius]|uniref:Uncharacterized protein n=1 Tax=Smallanthus sonchifolius TaxID=185202 RepID=A0ACB8ZBY7_9ASTR|nr:hypothetical protein L1987_78100 [Smallanthus sonchifolius]
MMSRWILSSCFCYLHRIIFQLKKTLIASSSKLYSSFASSSSKKIITHSATIRWIWGLSFDLFSKFHREISALDPPSRRPRSSSFNTLSSPINFSSRSFRYETEHIEKITL